MKYTFRPSPADKATHRRLSDDVLGILREHPDTVTIQPASAQVDPAGFAPYVEPPKPVPLPPAPSSEQLRARAKARRDELLSQGFEYGGKVIQTRNQTDVDNINGAALRATNDPTFGTAWIAADNSLLPLDAAGIIAMQSAMIARGQAIFAAYLAKLAEIAAAETDEARRAIDPAFAAP